jgi:acyl dehydratase
VTTTVDTVADLASLVGQPLGHSSWFEVTQERVNAFADATEDHQWIHVDPERAAQGPFGGTIAHGYLTLALMIPMWSEVLTVRQRRMGINYGLNRVRFPAPVRVGQKIRLSATLAAVEDVPGGVQVTVDCVVDADGSDKPACVAQAVFRILS